LEKIRLGKESKEKKETKENKETKETISLCAKWAPTERQGKDVNRASKKLAKKYRGFVHISFFQNVSKVQVPASRLQKDCHYSTEGTVEGDRDSQVVQPLV
jgi:hypothetical protein